MPHVIPLHDRIVLFRRLVAADRDEHVAQTTVITVERTRIIEVWQKCGNRKFLKISKKIEIFLKLNKLKI